MIRLALVFVLLLPVTVFAQHHITPFDTIPDFAAQPTVSSVKAGNWSDSTVWSTGAVPGSSDVVSVRHVVTFDLAFGTVRVLGVNAGAAWRCSLTQSTTLLVGTFQINPGGALWCGDVATPLPSQFIAQIVIRDQPLDAQGIDPFQYGTGLLVIDGTITMHGAPVATPFVRLSTEPVAGATTLDTETATGWAVGETVLMPDTRQLTAADYVPRPGFDADNFRRKVSQSETRTITGIVGYRLTLDTPLTFDHKGARDPDGVLQLLPHVGHLTRNIRIRSENPSGTRGHVFLTMNTTVDIRYVAFDHLGRTTEQPLDVTTVDASGVPIHIGTNQIGRYPLHLHHLLPANATVKGVVITDGRKWALTVHGTHYGQITDTIVYGATGSGIVTEDGSETSNIFDHNLVVKVESGAIKLSGVEAGIGGTDPAGRKGNGFWFRGPNNLLTNNVVADTREGYGYYSGSSETGPNSSTITVRIPKFPGADTLMTGQYTDTLLYRVYNRETRNNEAYSLGQFCLGTWFMEQPTTGRTPFTDTTCWHVAQVAVIHKYWNGTFDGLRVLNEGGVGVAVQQFNNGQTGMAMSSTLSRADIQGVETVYQKNGQLTLAPFWLFKDGVFRSKNGFILNALGQFPGGVASNFRWENVRFVALPGQPLRSFVLTETGSDVNTFPKIFQVVGYQGDATDAFRVYYASQFPGPKYGASAPCNTQRPEFAGAVVCPLTPPLVAQPPTATVGPPFVVTTCPATSLTAVPPDASGGWTSAFFMDGSPTPTTLTMASGSHSFTVQWSKTGQPTLTSQPTVKSCP